MQKKTRVGVVTPNSMWCTQQTRQGEGIPENKQLAADNTIPRCWMSKLRSDSPDFVLSAHAPRRHLCH